MGRIRSVDGDQYGNLKLRRLPLLSRFLFGYLCAEAADDEGRFQADPEAILDAVFPRTDPTTTEQVRDALQSLRSAGLLVIYKSRGVTYGFLTGWFEHQRIDLRYRRESGLPAPPVSVNSWAAVDRIREAYLETKGKHDDSKEAGRMPFRQALRWYTQLAAEHPEEARNILARIPREPRENPAPNPTGLEGNGMKGTGAPPAAGAPEQSPSGESGSRSVGTSGYHWAETGKLRMNLKQVCPNITADQGKTEDWCSLAWQLAHEDSYPLDYDAICEAVLTTPPSSVDSPKSWLLARKWDAEKQAKQADSPSSADWDRYAEPVGTNWGPEINRLGGPWKNWCFEVSGGEYARRSRLWGEAIKLAEAGDFSVLEAGPQVEVRV